MELINETLPKVPTENTIVTNTHKSAAAKHINDLFGQWLKQYRNHLGMTRAALARRINYSVDAIKKVENGQRIPSESMARLLAEALGITPELHGVFIRFGRTSISHPAFNRLIQREESIPSTTQVFSTPGIPRQARLPYPIKPIIDRASEVATVVELVTKSQARLITLHGAPGVGKTRLGLEVSNQLRSFFEDQVFQVSLAFVTSPDSVPDEVAKQLHLPLQELRRSGNAELPSILVETLRHKRTLLVLDNFEHVLPATALISYLLEQTPSLVIIVTSREALGLPDETRLLVQPLSYPTLISQLSSPEMASTYAAVQMFVQETRTQDAHFGLTPHNYAEVSQVCELVQGLPLCLELAAGQLARQSFTELLAQLQQHLSNFVLTQDESNPTLTPHHINLKQAIDWSFRALNPIEQQVFSALCVFTAPADEHAILAVCGTTSGTGLAGLIDASMLPYVLRSLCDKNLVLQTRSIGHVTRFNLMAPIRSVARDTIVAAAVMEKLHMQVIAHFESLANQPESAVSHPNHIEWTQRIDADYYNLLTSLEWCYVNATTRALQIAVNLAVYWQTRGRWHEGRRWLDRLIQSSLHPDTHDTPQVPIDVRARALSALAMFQLLQGEPITAIDTANKSLALAEASNNPIERGSALSVLGDLNYQLGDYTYTLAHYERALVAYREAGNRWHEATLLGQMGYLAYDQGDLPNADRLLNQSLIVWHGLSNQSGIASALQRLAQLELVRGRSEHAAELAQQSLTLYRKLEDRLGVATAIQRLGAAWLQMGQLDRAEQLLGEAIHQLQTLNSGIVLAEALTTLGRILHLQGRTAEAIAKHRAAIDLADQMHNRRVIATNLNLLAGALIGQNQPLTAAKLLAVATKIIPVNINALANVTAKYADTLKIDVQRHLSPSTFATAWEEGLSLNLKQIMALIVNDSI